MAASHGRRTLTRALVAILCCSLAAMQMTPAAAQSTTANTLASATQSGALNDPDSAVPTVATDTAPSAASSSSASSSSSSVAAAAPVATSIPPLDFTGTPVPFLMQRPIDSAYLQSSSGPHWRKTPYMPDVYFSGCSNSDQTAYVDADQRVNVSAVYVQWDPNLDDPTMGTHPSNQKGTLRIAAVGAIGQQAYATSNTSTSSTKLLSAINVESKVLSFDVFFNRTYLCTQLTPTTDDPYNPLVRPVASCAYGPGDVAFGAAIPLTNSFSASTIWTTIRLIDSSRPPLNIACIQVAATHYNPHSWWWKLIHYLIISIAAVYLILAFVSRIVTAITMRRRAFRTRINEKGATMYVQQRVGPALIGSLSGQGMIFSPALLRFATPGCWDIILHAQWVAMLGGFAVRWPEFVYPFFKQVTWATLLNNVTLIQADGQTGRYDVLATNATLPTDSTLAAQLTTNMSSPVWMNQAAPNALLNLDGARSGLEAYAHMIGLSPNDLFGTCLTVWLIFVAIIVALSAFVWVLSKVCDSVSNPPKNRNTAGMTNLHTSQDSVSEAKSGGDCGLAALTRVTGLQGALLHGNLVRALYLFYLPIVALSTYHLSTHADHSARSVALAALSLALLGILAPLYLVWCIARTSTQMLYEDVGTLLALGPLYNTYSPGSQLYATLPFAHGMIVGLVIGAAQSAGAIQAIFLVIAELALALVGSLWLPWGEGAMMGPLSFLASVCRLLTAILVLLLTPLVGFGSDVTGWLTYGVLLLQAIFFAAAILVLATKLIEGGVRVYARVGFDERHTARNAGLLGVLRRVRRRRYKGKRKGEKRISTGSADSDQDMALDDRHHAHGSGANSTLVGTASSSMAMKQAHQGSYGGAYDSAPSDFLTAGGPYQAYLRGDPHDDGNIMEALPAEHSVGSYDSTPGGGSAAPGPSSSFVRVGGGRATDAAPYQTLPRGQAPNDSTKWDPSVDPRSSFHALQNVRAGGAPTGQGARSGGKRKGLFGRGKRRKGEEEEEEEWSDDDDDEDEVGAWDSRTRRRPQWAGVAKLGAAFAALRGGRKEASHDGPIREEAETDDDDDAPSAPSKGFEVMRPPRPQRSPAASQTRTSTLLAPGASAALAQGSSDPPSPIADADDSQPFLPPGAGAGGANSKRFSRAGGASSLGHSDEGRNSEDRFWLPSGGAPRAAGADGAVSPGPPARRNYAEARWQEEPRRERDDAQMALQRERERVRRLKEAQRDAEGTEGTTGLQAKDMYYEDGTEAEVGTAS